MFVNSSYTQQKCYGLMKFSRFNVYIYIISNFAYNVNSYFTYFIIISLLIYLSNEYNNKINLKEMSIEDDIKSLKRLIDISILFLLLRPLCY